MLPFVVKGTGMRMTTVFKPFTFSCKREFLEKFGEKAYSEMKKLIEKIIKALLSWANRHNAVVAIWYKTVAYDKKGKRCPHVHGVLFADTYRARDKLNEQWRAKGLGFTGWRCSGHGGKPPSNAWWGDFRQYPKGLVGWIGGGFWDKQHKRPNKGYLNAKANRYGTAIVQRRSKAFNKARMKLSIYDINYYYQQGELCTLISHIKP